MKFTLTEPKKFLKVLAAIKKEIYSKNQKPILNCVKISVDESVPDTLILECTDLEMSIRVKVPADHVLHRMDYKEPLIVDIVDLIEMIKAFQDGQPTIQYLQMFEKETGKEEGPLSGPKYAIFEGKDIITFTGEDPAQFPVFPYYNTLSIPICISQAMKEETEKVLKSVSKDDIRYAMNGVSFSLNSGMAKFEGTDGRRLSRVQQNSYSPGRKFDAIIRPKAFSALKGFFRLFPDPGGYFLRVEENNTIFTWNAEKEEKNKVTIICRSIEGDFPNTERIWPGYQTSERMSFFPSDFLSALKRFPKNGENEAVKLSFNGDKIELFKEDERGRAFNFAFYAETKEPACPYLYLSRAFLLEGLQGLKAGELASIGVKGKKEPVTLSQGNYDYLVMPLNIEEPAKEGEEKKEEVEAA